MDFRYPLQSHISLIHGRSSVAWLVIHTSSAYATKVDSIRSLKKDIVGKYRIFDVVIVEG